MKVDCVRKWAVALYLGASALAGGFAHAQGTAPFNAATYNLRLNTEADGPDRWALRKDAVRALIRYHEFDLFGTQEGLADQIDDLAEMQEFDHAGVGRDDGRHAGEHSAIFFRRDRFELLGQGDFWLSQTPDRPSIGWDGRCCRRLASWVRLRERESGREFVVFSAHFDHEGVVARRESARLILRQAEAIAGPLPVICLGDLNSTPESDAARTLAARLRDARESSLAPPYGPVGTFNGFRLDAPLAERIDYIFVSEHFEVLKYAVLTDSFGARFPSDHLPVVARLRLR